MCSVFGCFGWKKQLVAPSTNSPKSAGEGSCLGNGEAKLLESSWKNVRDANAGEHCCPIKSLILQLDGWDCRVKDILKAQVVH